ncbi:MAG: FAD-dependent oxidoreductase [Dehalococcoidia bacterium]|nr:FAD-dependent oxidoreductase [Dehalococcoidia bacterium]
MSRQAGIVVIGGGVVGVCAAYYLSAQGHQVTLLEKHDICAGSSYGNGGLVAVEHALPVAARGRLSQVLQWLLDATSPFYIKPRFDLELLRWLWEFRAAGSGSDMLRRGTTLLALGQASIKLFEELDAREDIAFDYEHRGRLYLFRSPAGQEQSLEDAQLLQQFGVEPQILDIAGVRKLEPTVLPSVIGGVYYSGYAHLMPDRFVREVARLAQTQGTHLQTHTEVLGFERVGPRIASVVTTRGNFQPDQVVLAAGAWSPIVARDLRLRLPVQAAKGYGLMFNRPAVCPQRPLLLEESMVSVAPLGDTLRLSSTLELAGLDLTIDRRRVAATRGALGSYLAGMEDLELLEIWSGLRPLTSDTLPIIGRSEAFENLIVATGHGMLGLTHAPITGKLVAQLVGGETPALDLTPFRVERFS